MRASALFMLELMGGMETLTEIGNVHGASALADLFYLHKCHPDRQHGEGVVECAKAALRTVPRIAFDPRAQVAAMHARCSAPTTG